MQAHSYPLRYICVGVGVGGPLNAVKADQLGDKTHAGSHYYFRRRSLDWHRTRLSGVACVGVGKRAPEPHGLRVKPAVCAPVRATSESAANRTIQSTLSDSVGQQDSARIVDSATGVIGAPVVVRGDTVLYVPTRQDSFSPDERAAAISRRILGLTRTRVDSVVTVVNESSTDLMAADCII